ncbi:MAG: hypothetical protein ACYTEQ_20775 [Planctomycetota bacterium]|jgi:hypothetical protein
MAETVEIGTTVDEALSGQRGVKRRLVTWAEESFPIESLLDQLGKNIARSKVLHDMALKADELNLFTEAERTALVNAGILK